MTPTMMTTTTTALASLDDPYDDNNDDDNDYLDYDDHLTCNVTRTTNEMPAYIPCTVPLPLPTKPTHNASTLTTTTTVFSILHHVMTNTRGSQSPPAVATKGHGEAAGHGVIGGNQVFL
jgi:hypothetical protein